MLVVIANNLPPAVRGRMKLWFIEPKANIFVSGIKDTNVTKVIDYLYQYCPSSSGIIIFRSISKPPGYKILTIGNPTKYLIDISGLQLILEKRIVKS